MARSVAGATRETDGALKRRRGKNASAPIPSLSGSVDHVGQIAIAPDLGTSMRHRAKYYGALMDNLLSPEANIELLCGDSVAHWRLIVDEYWFPTKDFSVPDNDRNVWFSDLELLLGDAFREYRGSSLSLCNSRRLESGARWKLVVLVGPDELRDAKHDVKTVDKHGQCSNKGEACRFRGSSLKRDRFYLAGADELRVTTQNAMSRAMDDCNSGCDMGQACEEFAVAAKGFAQKIVSEQIRRFCQPLASCDRIAQSDIARTLDEKAAFASAIRKWTAPWNLRFLDPTTGGAYQLFAMTSGNPLGTMVLSRVGPELGPPRISSWGDVRRVLLECKLVEVPELHERKHSPRTR